jgi:hypothetical protein
MMWRGRQSGNRACLPCLSSPPEGKGSAKLEPEVEELIGHGGRLPLKTIGGSYGMMQARPTY